GYIFKVPGKGTFVSKPKTFQNISSLQGFAEAMSSAGHEILNRVISAELKQIPMYVVPKLKLPVKANVYEIQRVRLLNRQPVSYELTYLPEHIGLKLKEKAIDLRTTDIFKALEQECDIPLGHADLSIDATVADEELAALLQVEIGTPVLRVERLTHDANGQPIDYEYLYFSGDTFQYRLRIHR
ncbi:GntR family transcriptional regulator, partial [Acinetobacter baumannii]